MMRPVIYFLLVLSMINPFEKSFAQISWQPHPLQLNAELSEHVKFGYLSLPESRTSPDSREIHMAFTIISSFSDNPLPDPVIIIPGGPGFGASEFVEQITRSEFAQKILQNRDVVLVDPRGCGYSYPSICDNLNTDEFRLMSAFSRGAKRDAMLEEAVNKCVETIAATGVDVFAYNSVEVAHDLETLRTTLGYEKWNIRGHSYGSRYGMTLMQLYPLSVRSAVLSGLVPLIHYSDRTVVNLSRSLRLLFEKCETDPDCDAAFPDLESDFIHLLERLQNEPISIPDYALKSISRDAYFITPDMVLNGLFSLLYEKNGIEVIPLITHYLARGNDWIAQSMTIPLANQFSASKTDANFIISNNDSERDPDFKSQIAPDELTKLIGYYMQEHLTNDLFSYWPVIRGTNQTPKETWNPTDIPVLMISGEMDPVTPPEYAEAVSAYFSNGVHYVVSSSGHYPHSDARIDFSLFYENPDSNFDIRSHMVENSLQFATAVSLNRGISEALALLGAGSYQRFILPAIALVFCLIGFLFFPFRYIFRKIRKKGSEGMFMEILLIWMISFISLVIAALFYLAIMDTAAANPYVLAVGLSAKWDFIKIVAIALIILLFVSVWNVRKIWSSTSGLKISSVISIMGVVLFSLFIWISGLV